MAEQNIQLPAPLGKYTLEEFLGGGVAHLYRARDHRLNRTVVVKILSPASCKDKETRARFLREARMAGNMNHPNVISVFDFGEDQGRPYMVMEYLEGEDLHTAIVNCRTGDIGAKLSIALQVARALEAIHAANIIHRDIKPENIHLTPNGVVKMVDFGLAKSVDLSLTRPGFALGTPYYMAPEQILGQEVTALVDVYAFGLLICELMTGVKAVAGSSIQEIFRQIIHEPLNVEPLKKGGVPQPLIDLIVRTTAKKPSDRIPSFNAICAELEKMGTVAALPPLQGIGLPAASHKPVSTTLVVALVVGVLLILFALYAVVRWGASLKAKPVQPPAVATQTASPTIATPTGEMLVVPGASFYIDKAEVSNGAYAKFCEATGRPLPPQFSREHVDDPVSNVTIIDAKNFAQWAGKRLPTPQEWDKAAGTLKISAKLAEYVDEVRKPTPASVKYFSEALHTPTLAGEPWYSIRGGSFLEPLVPARYKSPAIGFRCVKSR